MTYDYHIVGAGFAGSVCARQLAEDGSKVLIIDRRNHIGGNAYDYVNEDGVRIHKYGPHLFHTNSDKVWNWLSRFTEWTPYEHRVLASVEGKLVPFPVNLTTLEMLGLEHLKPPEPSSEHPANAEEQCLQRVGRELYEMFFKGYTTKMWGRHPRELDASVTARIPVRWDSRDDRYFTDKHQAMPKDGYTALFERMLEHENIKVMLNHCVGKIATTEADSIIWTGPIDQHFAYCFGAIPYRSLRFDHQVWESYPPNYMLPAPTVNFPSADMKFTRVTEWAQIAGKPAPRSVLTYETPCAEGEPFYPMPTPEAKALYKQYEALADSEPHVTFLGRLGTYQYLNMDQVVAQALAASERLIKARAA